MSSLRPRLLLIFLLLVVIASTLQQVSAATQHYSLTVPAGGREQVQVNLRKGDVVQFYISAVKSNLGQGQIDFSIIAPNGQVVYSQNSVSTLRDTYTATADGTYYLTFTNSGLLFAETVEVDVTIVSGSPCVIATAAYGSDLAAPVQFLRNFRDHNVERTYLGSQFLQGFNAWYYSWAPAIADSERGNIFLRQGIQVLILPLLGSLAVSSAIFQLLAPMNSELAILIGGLAASALIGFAYLSPLTIILSRVTRRLSTARGFLSVSLVSAGFTLFGTVLQGTVGAAQIIVAFLVIETMLSSPYMSPRLVKALMARLSARDSVA